MSSWYHSTVVGACTHSQSPLSILPLLSDASCFFRIEEKREKERERGTCCVIELGNASNGSVMIMRCWENIILLYARRIGAIMSKSWPHVGDALSIDRDTIFIYIIYTFFFHHRWAEPIGLDWPTAVSRSFVNNSTNSVPLLPNGQAR